MPYPAKGYERFYIEKLFDDVQKLIKHTRYNKMAQLATFEDILEKNGFSRK